jgi:hypothetical protein
MGEKPPEILKKVKIIAPLNIASLGVYLQEVKLKLVI